MSLRRSLKFPITLAIVMIVLLVALIVAWVWITVVGALAQSDSAPFFWTVLPVGTTFLVLVLVGVVLYMTLMIKTINLTKRQSNFIDSVTHELKSPIASLKLILQTLNRRKVSQEELESFYRFMLDDVERLDQLINHVLEAGRLERDPVEVEVERVQLPMLLEECASIICLRYRLPESTILLNAQPCFVRAKPIDLDMIFRNLIDNAVKYAGSEPSVSITLQLDGETAVTRITDNGRGIPPKLRRKIFGRFVRLGMELERQKQGTGLGLYIVRTLVRRLRGEVRVYDAEQGVGTVFEVRLPAEPPHQEAPTVVEPTIAQKAEVA